MGTSASFYTQLLTERVHVDPRPKISKKCMAEDRLTGAPVLSATGSYVEYITPQLTNFPASLASANESEIEG